MKQWLPILLLVLTMPACGSGQKTTPPAQATKQLNPTWAALGVELPIDNADIEYINTKRMLLKYSNKQQSDTRAVHTAVNKAFLSAGWKENQNREYHPNLFSALYSKGRKRIGVDTQWYKTPTSSQSLINNVDLVRCSVTDYSDSVEIEVLPTQNDARIKQVQAAAKAVGVDEQVFNEFNDRFSWRHLNYGVLTVPFTMDALGFTIRADGPYATHTIQSLFADTKLAVATDFSMADVLIDFQKEPIEVTATAKRGEALSAVEVGFVGNWNEQRVWETLPRLGVNQSTKNQWDELNGSTGSDDIFKVNLGFTPEGQHIDVCYGQKVRTEHVSQKVDQIHYLAEEVGIAADQAAWLRDLFREFCLPPVTASMWTISTRPDQFRPVLKVTWANVPKKIVLKLMADLADVKDAPSRLDALLAATNITNDQIWRLTVEVGAEGRPKGSLSLRLD